MNLWILDTDSVSLFLEGNPQIGEQAASKFPDVAITIRPPAKVLNKSTEPIFLSIFSQSFIVSK
jgi:hypothetical protein